MHYPANFEPADEGGFVVTFRDIPEAITQGDTLEEAQAMAADALLTALEFYFEDSRPVPLPSACQPGERLVSLQPSLWVKVLLLNEMQKQEVRPIDLARRMGVKAQEVTRLLNLHHTTKVDAVEQAVNALGKRLELSLAD